jgi:microcin C transport system substrate-binding protein
VSDGSGQDRTLLRKASALLQEAGYAVKDGRRVTPLSEAFIVEFLIDDPVSLPHHNAFIKNLWILGIEANVRVVDPVQYRNRVNAFDFDIVVQRFGFSSTPGDTLRTFFTSRAANISGSQNVGGISDPAIDALVEHVIAADSRPALLAACKALDRVIRSGRYWVPHWYRASHWLAYWNVFGRPEAQPRYALATRETWWSNA